MKSKLGFPSQCRNVTLALTLSVALVACGAGDSATFKVVADALPDDAQLELDFCGRVVQIPELNGQFVLTVRVTCEGGAVVRATLVGGEVISCEAVYVSPRIKQVTYTAVVVDKKCSVQAKSG